MLREVRRSRYALPITPKDVTVTDTPTKINTAVTPREKSDVGCKSPYPTVARVVTVK